MKFHSNTAIAQQCFRKLKWRMFFIIFFVGVYGLFQVAYNFHAHHVGAFSIFIALLFLFFFSKLLYIPFRAVVLMNMTVSDLEISEEKIIVETFSASMFFGLLQKDSMIISIPRQLAGFEMSDNKYGFDRQLTGDIYHLTYAGDRYLVAYNFFDHFHDLRLGLQSNNAAENNTTIPK